jgi:spore maturation protein CgeB
MGLKRHVKFLVNWSTDDIYNDKSSSEHVVKSVPLYDLIFSPRPHLFNEFIAIGAKSIKSIDWYPHPELLNCKHLETENQKNYDVSFVGSWSHYRENILTPLAAIPNGISVFGWGWDTKVSHHLKKEMFKRNPHINLSEMLSIFSGSKINLNILTKENRDTTNLRNFEIPATRAFQLAERSDDLLKLFEEDKEVVCFSGDEELRSKCEFYINNDASRKKIAQAGYDRLIKSRYTLDARLEMVINSVREIM